MPILRVTSHRSAIRGGVEVIPDDLLPEKYREFAFIAGGFAACPSLASDMDVWVLTPYPARMHDDNIPFDDLRVHVWLQERRQELLEHLKAKFSSWRLTEYTEYTDTRIVQPNLQEISH